ncbi:dTMP kinase [Sandarakinorhabdus cyanobacteriorum]|uniref:Thymidylate kinase n=1 Tax=Sandarakinorhabdus cyanobacteriorum TaxID=1981098 RepID=A0A255YG36_9SPHN|nr:dTMP kinase [Sandarakinorhabdus cyanobacteriorum]OYQ28232.1 dTMP kinase [Sandarakinorhabdus cyanobacteriorum]
MLRGRFITLEGGEGSGKSTQARLLADAIGTRGHEVVLTREPGGTAGAEAIRSLLVSGETDRWTPWSEALLMTAARVDHVARVIRPALERGAMVICDRYVDSTRAYQGAGHGLSDAVLTQLHADAVGLWPDLTLVFQLDEAEGLARAAARGGDARFEAFGREFHARINGFFAELPALDPARCRAIDASGSVADVAARIMAVL